jgi:hypothetical protein
MALSLNSARGTSLSSGFRSIRPGSLAHLLAFLLEIGSEELRGSSSAQPDSCSLIVVTLAQSKVVTLAAVTTQSALPRMTQ